MCFFAPKEEELDFIDLCSENSIRAPDVPILEQGKKEYSTTVTPLFLVCCPTPRSQSKNNYGVYFFLGKQGKRVYTIGPERRVHTIEASDPGKEKKGGFPRWWCVFSPCLNPENSIRNRMLPGDCRMKCPQKRLAGQRNIGGTFREVQSNSTFIGSSFSGTFFRHGFEACSLDQLDHGVLDPNCDYCKRAFGTIISTPDQGQLTSASNLFCAMKK